MIEALASSMSCSTVLPSAVSVARRASRSATLLARAACAILVASSWKPSFLATKSVSQFSSTRTPALVPSSSAMTRPLRRGPVGPLARVLDALLAQELDGLVDVAIGLGQGVLAVHHAGAGQVPEPLHVSGGKIRHCLFLAWSGCQRHSALSAAASAASGVASAASAVSAVSGVASAASPQRSQRPRESPRRRRPQRSRRSRGRPQRSRRRHRPRSVTVDSGRLLGRDAERCHQASRSRSHSGSGSSLVGELSSAGFSSATEAPARDMRPSATASATTRVSSATERIASSLPGIG